jgi:hypothetical protein
MLAIITDNSQSLVPSTQWPFAGAHTQQLWIVMVQQTLHICLRAVMIKRFHSARQAPLLSRLGGPYSHAVAGVRS